MKLMGMKRWNGTLLLLGLAHSLNHSLFLVLPPLLEDISRDLGASFQTIGAASTIAFFLYGLGALVGGPLSDRIGHVRVASVSTGLSGVATVIFLLPGGLAPFTTGLWVVALAASLYHPTANTLIAKLFPVNTAQSMGIHGASGSVGQMFTPAVAYFIGVTFHWRYAFVFFGAVSIVTSLLMQRIPSAHEPHQTERTPLIDVLRVPGFWILILYNVIIGLFQRGVELFFPTFLVLERGFTGQLAAFYASALLFFGAPGQLLGGWAADKYTPRRFLVVASAGMVASMLSLLLVPSTIGVVGFLFIYGVFFFGHQPTMTTLLSSITPSALMGMAYGVMFFFAFGLGSVSTTIAGYLADNFSLEAVFWIMALFSLVTLGISLMVTRVIGDKKG
jgi:MFS family permease